MATSAVWEKLFGENPLLHTSTFGGNPLACTVALEAINVIEDENLCEASSIRGARLKSGLTAIKNEFPDLISDVRGIGLMLGVEFTMDDVGELTIGQMVKRGVVAAYTLNNRRVIRFEPPLIISDEQVDRAVEVFRSAVAETASLLEAVKG
jgi:putrescine aminotransferase